MRPPRESYVRVTTEHDGWTCEPAIEHRPGDSFEVFQPFGVPRNEAVSP